MVDSSGIKLYYFAFSGKMSCVRLTLAAGGIAFENVCPAGMQPSDDDKAEWLKLGGNTTTNVPMMVCGDKAYTQSSAVIRVAARKAGLMPTDDEEVYQVDNMIAHVADSAQAAFKAIPMFGAKQDAVDNFIEKDLPKHVGNIDRILGDKEYFVGGKLSVADIVVYDHLTEMIDALVPGSLATWPKLEAFVKRVGENEKIAAYKASEGYTKLGRFPPSVEKKE